MPYSLSGPLGRIAVPVPWMRGVIPRFRISRRVALLGSAGALVALTLAYFGTCMSIAASVESISADAVRDHPGDRVLALLAIVESETQPLAERDRAVWALGQLGDPRALPLLERLYTDEPCDHETHLCQQELAKAIRGCRGGANVTAWLWR